MYPIAGQLPYDPNSLEQHKLPYLSSSPFMKRSNISVSSLQVLDSSLKQIQPNNSFGEPVVITLKSMTIVPSKDY